MTKSPSIAPILPNTATVKMFASSDIWPRAEIEGAVVNIDVKNIPAIKLAKA